MRFYLMEKNFLRYKMLILDINMQILKKEVSGFQGELFLEVRFLFQVEILEIRYKRESQNF